MKMTPKEKFEHGLTIFLRNRDVSNKDKIYELEDMISLCKSAIVILQGNGITSASHMMNVLDEVKI